MASTMSLYDTSIAMFINSLNALAGVLKKAKEHAQANGVDLNDYFEGRLAPDMFAFPRQIQIACDTAKFTAVRVAGVESLTFEDNEKTFEDLQARITKTVEFLGKLKREAFDGKETAEVTYRERKFTGLSYCTGFAIPNFYFHVVCAYAILRHKGAPIGKWDYLGIQQ